MNLASVTNGAPELSFLTAIGAGEEIEISLGEVMFNAKTDLCVDVPTTGNNSKY